jgi:hypothetical protein
MAIFLVFFRFFFISVFLLVITFMILILITYFILFFRLKHAILFATRVFTSHYGAYFINHCCSPLVLIVSLSAVFLCCVELCSVWLDFEHSAVS